MLKISTPTGQVKVSPDINIPLTLTNPLFNDRGSYSLPFTLPLKPNSGAFRSPGAIQLKTSVGDFVDCALEQRFIREKGPIKIIDITASTLEVTLTTREGAFWEWAKKTKLRSINTPATRTFNFVSERDNYFNNIWPDVEMAIFPIATTLQYEQYTKTEFWNGWAGRKLCIADYILWNNPSDLYRNDTDRSGPVTGFLYINEVIQWIATTYGLKVKDCCLASTEELRRAVVLNKCYNFNLFGGESLYYYMLLPDVSVLDFITSLETTFGCTFYINPVKKELNARFIKSSISPEGSRAVNATISPQKLFEPHGFSLKNSKSGSPYISINKSTINNPFFTFDTEGTSRVHDKVYVTAASPNYITYPNKFVFCTSTQAYFRLYWVQNGSNWDYKAEAMHSSYHDLSNNEDLQQHKIDSKSEFVPMVPVTCRQFYVDSGNQYFDFNITIPHFESWDWIFSFTDSFIAEDTTETPISFAFYRGRVETINFPVTLFGINSFNMPYGTVDVYNKSGNVISGASIAMRWVGQYGLYETFYKELEQLFLTSAIEVSVENLPLTEFVYNHIFEVFRTEYAHFIIKEINLTITATSIIVDSITAYTTKPYI